MRTNARAKLSKRSLTRPCKNKAEVFEMEAMLERGCGLDVHKDKIEACIMINTTPEIEVIRERFGSTAAELKRLSKWIEDQQVKNVAMESTGVYWMPIYEALESNIGERIDILVANAYHMKNVPGRKTDVKDAQWIAELLLKGLLEHSYVPNRYMRDVREISRARRKLIRERVREWNHVEKYLQAHGIKLTSVLSSITCVTAQEIIKVFAEKGEITQEELRRCRRGTLKHSEEEMYEALCVKLTKTEQRMLKYHMTHIEQLDQDELELNEMLSEMMADCGEEIDIAVSIPGISTDSAIEIFAEIGVVPQDHFQTKERLCKWAGLSPRNSESAGNISNRKTLHGNPYIKSILVQCAWAAVKCRKSQLNDWFWRKQSVIGRKKAIVAVARKLLALLYTLLEKRECYKPVITA